MSKFCPLILLVIVSLCMASPHVDDKHHTNKRHHNEHKHGQKRDDEVSTPEEIFPPSTSNVDSYPTESSDQTLPTPTDPSDPYVGSYLPVIYYIQGNRLVGVPIPDAEEYERIVARGQFRKPHHGGHSENWKRHHSKRLPFPTSKPDTVERHGHAGDRSHHKKHAKEHEEKHNEKKSHQY